MGIFDSESNSIALRRDVAIIDSLADGTSTHDTGFKGDITINADVVIVADEGIADLVSGMEEVGDDST